MKQITKEPQYQKQLILAKGKGLTPLGLATNLIWFQDPRRLCFLLSRYKFVAKMLSGKKKVLEIGCGDAFGTRIVLQEVSKICAVDFDPILVKDVNKRMEKGWRFDCRVHDIIASPLSEKFDAAYCLDVIEHIPKTKERRFLSNIAGSLKENATLIIGTPSAQSQIYAAKASKEGHINCKDYNELKNLMLKYFYNVFVFSMNDEVVHTGFYPMAHYFLILCAGKRARGLRS